MGGIFSYFTVMQLANLSYQVNKDKNCHQVFKV